MDRLFPKKDPEGLKRLLATPESQLTTNECERRYTAVRHATPVPCPMCFEPVSLYEAGDDTQAVNEPYDGQYFCPNCDTELAKIAPFYLVPGTPGWHWQRKHPIPGKKQRTEGS
jgi:hypothetical protein